MMAHMSQSKTRLILVLVVIAISAFLYRQYAFYRIPDVSKVITVSDKSKIQQTGDVLHSIPLDEIVSAGPLKDGIPSIDDPKFESVVAADQYLDNKKFGLAVEVEGDWRFYPYQIIVWHEIVNDVFNGKPLLVTYCPLCFSGMVFDSEVRGEVVSFGTSGKLYNSNLLMYDRKTDSLWSQILGEAVVGELTGENLEQYPALTMTWEDFRSEHERGEVLSRKTSASRDYTMDPYADYYSNASIWFPLSNKDSRLDSKELVYGVRLGDAQKAYTFSSIQDEEVINDVVGGIPLLIIFDPYQNTINAFIRLHNGEELTFEADGNYLREMNSDIRWNYSGRPIEGVERSAQLKQIPIVNSFWFNWVVFFPDTEVF